MDSMRSERFRYLLPGSYLIICLALIYYPQLLTNNASNKFSNIFILGIGAIIGGFLLNRLSTSTIFRLLIGFGGSKTVHGKDTAELVVYKVLDELNIRSTPTGNKVIQKTAEIFDDFLNEECDDKVIGRFFFLCDMEHAFATLSLCSISVIIISALTIIEIVLNNGLLAIQKLSVISYIINIFFFFVFVRNAQRHYNESVRYSDVLIVSQLDKLYNFIKTFAVYQFLIDFENKDSEICMEGDFKKYKDWLKFFKEDKAKVKLIT